jgi:hypothetical protein
LTAIGAAPPVETAAVRDELDEFEVVAEEDAVLLDDVVLDDDVVLFEAAVLPEEVADDVVDEEPAVCANMTKRTSFAASPAGSTALKW